MTTVALLHNGSESAVGKLFAHAEATASAAREVQQHLSLAYGGLQDIVNFLGLDIDVVTILTCEDPPAGMQVTVGSVLCAIQSLAHEQPQPEASFHPQRYHDPRSINERWHLPGAPDAASVGNDGEPVRFESDAACIDNISSRSAPMRPPNEHHAPAQTDQAKDSAYEEAPGPRTRQQRASSTEPPIQLQPHTTSNHLHQPHLNVAAHPGLLAQGQVKAVSPSPTPTRHSSLLPNGHASPPILTCQLTDLHATPPSQRQQRQNFPETEVFVPFFPSQMAAVPKPVAQCCVDKPGPGAAVEGCTKRVSQHAATERRSAAIEIVGGPSEKRNEVGSHAVAECHDLQQQLHAQQAAAADDNVTHFGMTAAVAAQQGVEHQNHTAAPAAAGFSAHSGPAMPAEQSGSASKASPCPQPAHLMPAKCLTASKLVPTPADAMAMPPPSTLVAFCQSGQVPAVPRAVGASFGWRPLGAIPASSKRLATDTKSAPHTPAAPGSSAPVTFDRSVGLVDADREDMADKDAKAVAMPTDHADVPRGGAPKIVSAQATSSATQQDVAVISDRPDDTCGVVGGTDQGASLLPTPVSQLQASHGNKHQQRSSGASGEAAVAPVLRGGDGHVSCEMDEGCGDRSQCEGVGPRSLGPQPAGGASRLGTEASAQVCGAPSSPDSAERRELADGGPAARARKGEWRRRGTRARTGTLAESQADLTQDAPFGGVAQPAEGLGAAVVKERKDAGVPSAAATATFRAAAGASPVAAAAAKKRSASKPPRASPPVNVAEILSRSPARCAASAQHASARPTRHTHTAAPAALEEARPPPQAASLSGARHASCSGGAAAAAARGDESAAPAGGGGSGPARTRPAAAAVQPSAAVALASDGKAVRKGPWQSRKNTNAIFESKDRKRTGRIDTMLRSAPTSSGKNASAGPALVLKKADVAAGFDGTLQQRRVAAATAAAAASGGTVRVGAAKVYDQRVRKRAERDALQAWECGACMEFYEVLARQGYEYNAEVFGDCSECGSARKKMCVKRGGPTTEHAQGESPPGTPEAKGDGAGILLQAVGRHRHKFVAPPTQENFWAVGFDDDWDAPKRPWRKNGVNKNRMVS